MKITYIGLLLLIPLFFSGCGFGDRQQDSHAELNQKASASASLFVYTDGAIQRIRQNDGVVISSFPLNEAFTPITFSANQTFVVSADQKYVVWFVPGKGMVRFDTAKQTVDVFYSPTEWFYENPYFSFLGEQNILILIDKKGSEDVWINLDTGETSTRSVPYPFGTLFLLSPDLQRIAYVEGYGQTVGNPTYLITTISGEPVTQFETAAEVAGRAMIAWMPDSRSLITVESGRKLVRYPLEQAARPELVYELPEGESVLSFESRGPLLLIGSPSFWSLYDMGERKLLRRLPVEAMSQLTKPKIVWFDKDSFFVEEDVRSFEQTFKRLWTSDWTGDRRIIVPSYGRRVTQQNAF